MNGKIEPKPTAGYPTQHQAIVALHVTGKTASAIAEEVGCSRDTVHAAIARYRNKTGHIVVASERTPSPVEELLWDGEEDDRRRAFALKAKHGARLALKAMGASL